MWKCFDHRARITSRLDDGRQTTDEECSKEMMGSGPTGVRIIGGALGGAAVGGVMTPLVVQVSSATAAAITSPCPSI